jgi:tetratricopeptide (TPR) repeat protein
LISKLGGLPLALVQAGAYLGVTGMTVAEYMSYYNATWDELMRNQDQYPLQEYAERSVLATWKMTYDQVKNVDAQAALLLDLWAFLDPGDVWAELVLVGDCKAAKHDLAGDPVMHSTTKLSIQHSIGILTQYSMVTASTANTRHAVHPVVHAWCLHNLGDSATKREMLAAALRCVSKMAQSIRESVTREEGLRLAAHARAIAGSVTMDFDDGDGHEECDQIAYFLDDWEKSKEVETLYMRALGSYEKARGPDHLDTLRIANNLGILYSDQGKIAEAEQMYLRALRGYEKVWGPDITNHAGAFMTLNNLGNLYLDQGNMAEAEEYYSRALRGFEKVRGTDHADTLDTVNNLGNLYLDQGKIEEAEEMYLRALRGREEVSGADHSSTLDTVNNLGNLYFQQSKTVEAEEMYLRALHGKEKAWGPDHTSTLDTIRNLGILYSDQGRIWEAEDMYLRALHGYEKAWGQNHPDTLSTIDNLGILYSLDREKMASAEEMYLLALRRREKELGPDHTDTLETVYNLGLLYSSIQGRTAEADTMYLRALRGFEETRGADHISTLQTVYNLGLLYSLNQDRLAEAEVMYSRAVRGKEKTLGLDHVKTLSAIYNLAVLYSRRGKTEEAVETWLRIINIAPHATVDQVRVVGLSLHALLTKYRQRASESVSIRSGRHLRLLSALTPPECWPQTIWSKVLDLRIFLERSPDTYLYSLGRILQGIGDGSNAVRAFQHFKTIGQVVCCDGCGRDLLDNENQYACKTCDDTDFCEDCWLLCHDSDGVQEHRGAIPQCTGHSFCKIPGIEPTEIQDPEVAQQAAKAWITELFESGPTFAT